MDRKICLITGANSGIGKAAAEQIAREEYHTILGPAAMKKKGTQIWCDGEGMSPEHVDQEMRKLLYQMDRTVLEHEVKDLGKCLPNTEKPAFSRVRELKVPLLSIIGSHEKPDMFAAADFMMENIKSA